MLKNAKNMEPTHDSQYRLCKGNNKKGLAIKDTTFEYVIYAWMYDKIYQHIPSSLMHQKYF